MQKKIIILVLLTLLLVIITFIIFIKHDDQSEYPTTGRDLHEYFGDARFTILNGHDISGNNTLVLYDAKKIETIDEEIKIYDEINGYVYLIGKKGYTFLDYVKGEYIQSKDLSSFKQEELEKFQELEKQL